MDVEEVDTANTACRRECSVIVQRGFLRNGELSLQGLHDALKHVSIRTDGGIIAAKVDIHAAAGQLGIDFAKRAHVIRSYQDVTDPSGILEMFEMVELTLETTAPGGCRQVMGFIHNDGEGLASA